MKKLVALLIVALAFATAPAFSADFDKGWNAYYNGDYATALQEFRPLAEQGHAEAQYNLGWMYRNGSDVPQDYKIATKWYTLSAEQGHADAQHNLGVMYEKGSGVLQDYKQAVKWYRLSAEQGNEKGQFNLAVMYGKGHGVPRDYARAHMWFNLAASNGNENAVEVRDALAEEMASAQIEKAQDLARECLAKDYKGC